MLSRLSMNLGQRLVSTSNRSSPKVMKFVAITSVRHQSTINSEPIACIADIPQDTPNVAEVAETILKFHPNGEPTSESLGLSILDPIVLVQKGLEILHTSCDLSWWTTIVAGTVVIRLFLLPFMIKAQKNGVKMKENMPIITELNKKRALAKNREEANKHLMEMHKLMKEKQISIPKILSTMLVPVPVFISMFFGLRAMANTPLESLKEGGLWWCKDLTIADPYYILPLLNSLTIYLTLKRSLATGEIMLPPQIKYVFYILPVITFPFLCNFPGIMLCYFITTNICTLIQTEVLQLKRVRTYLKLPDMTNHQSMTAVNSEDLVKAMSKTWSNTKNAYQSSEKEITDTSFDKTRKQPMKGVFNPPKNPLSTVQIKTKKR
ncbi:OXA1L mitochondrial inner membrane protein [Nomia melanderi]|uniref:OXA1L mitochondrial inner membrane protein n=1 Tax=Nomia melanderi TaxID=2448451 RepID=UPI0013040E57|nr:mitochondrial inner membrane protein OXA1L-like [Nomia melanderi]